MRSRVNLATSPFVNYRRFALGAGLLALVALTATVWVGRESVRVWQERTSRQARWQELRAERARLMSEQEQLETELEHPATQAVLQRTRFLNDLIRQKNLSWTRLFFDLAGRLPAGVRVVSLSPHLREDGRLEVQLQVGSESAPAMIEFLRALEDGDKFDEVQLHSQNFQAGRDSDALTTEVSVIYRQE
ncbi:MAG: hypothetical protein ACE5G6_02935 [Terriglobia bacterium]